MFVSVDPTNTASQHSKLFLLVKKSLEISETVVFLFSPGLSIGLVVAAHGCAYFARGFEHVPCSYNEINLVNLLTVRDCN